MSRELIRKPITAEIVRLVAMRPGLLVEFDNELTVDIAIQTLPFLSVQIEFITAEQVDLAENPLKRTWGSIYLGAMVKENSGTRAANEMLDFITPHLERKRFGAVRTFMGSVTKAETKDGWQCIPVVIPFWSDQITS